MSESDTKLMRAEPGILVYYTLDELIRLQKGADPNEWGICSAEHSADDVFWIGKRIVQSGEDLLRVSLHQILQKRGEMYPGLADEMVYIFVGFEEESGNFVWFLLNEERALSCIAREQHAQENAPDEDQIVHRVRLADLDSLPELLGVSSDNLGLEINGEGDLVPKVIDEDDDPMSLTQIWALAEKHFPQNSHLDLVVQVRKVPDGRVINISTMEYVLSAEGNTIKSRWWKFTDTYRKQMN